MMKTLLAVLKERKETAAYSFFAVLVVAAFLMNFVSLPAFVQGKILFADAAAIDVIFLLLFSLLSAAAITMYLYTREKMKTSSHKHKAGLFGGFLGLFTSACTVCYPFMLSFLGIPAALAALPFGGAELRFLSIALLALSIYFIAQSIRNCARCNQ